MKKFAKLDWLVLPLLGLAAAREDEHDGLTHRLIRAVPENPFSALVPTGDDAVQILADDGIVR